MTEPAPVYYTALTPTDAELKLLARLREIRGMCIVDSDSMTLWAGGRAEPCNGRRREAARSLPFVLPIDT